MKVRLSWLDVFTDVPFAGNPLAVVPDGDGLGDDQMQALARELGLSETVFAVDDARRLRIFTPVKELPLAGHPTVGCALELARLGRIPADGRWVFKTGAGDTPVDLVRGEVATMTQAEPELGLEHDLVAVTAALQVSEDVLASHPRMCTTTGVRQLFAEVRSREELAGLAPDVEDPATGSAAGALGALRVFLGGESGELLVRQGEEIGRPSEMRVEVDGEPGTPTEVRVGGRAVLVMEGEVELPQG
jgi:trans-2,3-dihydro-3-hydroxyanthranilate isomerase